MRNNRIDCRIVNHHAGSNLSLWDMVEMMLQGRHTDSVDMYMGGEVPKYMLRCRPSFGNC